MTPEELYQEMTEYFGIWYSEEQRESHILKLIRQTKKEWCRQYAIEFGLWVRENSNKENFDFSRGDTNGWYDEWIRKYLNNPNRNDTIA